MGRICCRATSEQQCHQRISARTTFVSLSDRTRRVVKSTTLSSAPCKDGRALATRCSVRLRQVMNMRTQSAQSATNWSRIGMVPTRVPLGARHVGVAARHLTPPLDESRSSLTTVSDEGDGLLE